MSLLHIAGGATEDKLMVEDVFSTYLYTGNGSTQTINNGIDLAGKGGMVWTKARSTTSSPQNNHRLYDSVKGINGSLISNSTAANDILGVFSSWNSNGFTLGGGNPSASNVNAEPYASWTFRKAPKFFDIKTKVHTNGTASTVDLSTLGVVGMVTVKSTIGTSNWFTWHKNLTAGNNLKLNLTDTESTTNAYLSVSGTTLTIASAAPSNTYIIYAWAHDTSADGIIQCGSYVGNGLVDGPTINLGWEPQYVLIKSSTYTNQKWIINDIMRGMTDVAGNPTLYAHLSAAENPSIKYSFPTTLGFKLNSIVNDTNRTGETYIYIAIRRPMKTPTSGTEVYNAIARTGTGAAATVTGVGFAPDLMLSKRRTATTQTLVWDRLRGVAPKLLAQSTVAEDSSGSAVQLLSFEMDGIKIGTDSGFDQLNMSGGTQIDHFFKRAKGFMTITAHTDLTSSDVIAHDLGAIPEMIWAKCRSTAEDWFIYHKDLTSGYTLKFTTAAEASDASRFTSLSATQFTYGGGTAARTRIFYSFATLAGISKVFTFTADISKTINCGFTTGARFIMLKKKNGTGSFYIWDSVRGIVSGNDPYLLLDSTAAEVTSTDLIDPEASGFISNFTDGGTYIGLAIA